LWRDEILQQVTDIWDQVDSYLAAEGLELDDLELTGRGPSRVLRVTVDGTGVDLDRLAEISRGLSRLLDDAPDLQERYRLEVSSPGLERKLRRPSHYSKSVGREVVVKTSSDGVRASYRGVLTDVSDQTFSVESEGGDVTIPYDEVVTARTVFRWEKTPKPGH
jgi:ribosome maturation factor RimP